MDCFHRLDDAVVLLCRRGAEALRGASPSHAVPALAVARVLLRASQHLEQVATAALNMDLHAWSQQLLALFNSSFSLLKSFFI